jgi:catechol 2,3-dioxygenase-like lactoylglutathione lyase family enzyme
VLKVSKHAKPKELDMSNTRARSETAFNSPKTRGVDMKLEIVVIPVSDVDRAKRFYGGLGWRLDADVSKGNNFRVLQFMPSGSSCSIIFGTGVTAAVPGSAQGLHLIVSDIEAARSELVNHGVNVSEVFHDAGGVFHHVDGECLVSGLDPQRAGYTSYASFNDPDGNAWVLQEVTERLSGGVKAGDTRFTTQLVNAALRMAAAQQPSAVPTPRTSLFVIPTRQQ